MTGFVLKLIPDAEMAAVLGDIINRLIRIEGLIMTEAEIVAQLATEVSAQTTVIESAMTLIDGLVAAIGAASDVSPQVQAIIDQVKAQRDALAAKVLANTPSGP